jgi:hypothetical protein
MCPRSSFASRSAGDGANVCRTVGNPADELHSAVATRCLEGRKGEERGRTSEGQSSSVEEGGRMEEGKSEEGGRKKEGKEEGGRKEKKAGGGTSEGKSRRGEGSVCSGLGRLSCGNR